MKYLDQITNDSIKLIENHGIYKLHITTPNNDRSNLGERIRSLKAQIPVTFANPENLLSSIQHALEALNYSEFTIKFEEGKPIIEDQAKKYFKEALETWLSNQYLDSRDESEIKKAFNQAFDHESEELDLFNFKFKEIPVKLLERLPSLKKIKVRSCSELEKLDLSRNPKLEMLDCAGCSKLTTLNLIGNPKLQNLNCSHTPITTLDLMNNPELQKLICASTRIKTLNLTNQPKLRDLICANTQINELDLTDKPELKTLDCAGTEINALDLSNNPELRTLDCADTLIPALNLSQNLKIQNLRCENTPINTLDLANNTKLYSLNCANTQIDTLDLTNTPKLGVLDCSKTPISKLDLPNISNPFKLLCGECPNLTTLDLTNIPQLYDLKCYDCYALTRIDLSSPPPQLQWFNCRNCPQLAMLPEVPDGCQVISSAQFSDTTYQVSVTDLNQDTLKVLKKLTEFLNKRGVYPSIHFIEEDGSPSLGIDVGGLRRHLQSTLFMKLFTNPLSDLPFHLDQEGKIRPMVDLTMEPQIENYRTIGALFAFAYQNNLPIGTLFTNQLFDAILTLSEEDLENLNLDSLQEKTQRTIFFVLYKESYSFISNYLEDKATKEDLEKIKFLIESDPAPSKEKVMKHLHETMNEPQINQSIVAALVLAKEVYTWFKKMQISWQTIQENGSKELQAKIEGELSREIVLDRLNYSGTIDEKTKGYLTTWIQSSKLEEIKHFVKAVTGSPSLGLTVKMNVRLFSPDNPNTLPSAHTCDYQLDLPITYASQELFNDKLQTFINESLAGSGFQFG